jgi:hypothetical protein
MSFVSTYAHALGNGIAADLPCIFSVLVRRSGQESKHLRCASGFFRQDGRLVVGIRLYDLR